MLVSLKWLSEYVPLTLPVRELASKLSICGVKVERIISRGDEWEDIRVARVLDVQPHPNADRLRLVTVDEGTPPNPTVVCGAPNVAVGQKVAFAAAGVRLRDGHTGEWTVLKAARIRGVDSAGMVLSERELGISDEHQGILELPQDAPVGEALRDYYGDALLEIEVTPNRPDHMSMLGIAWEVAAQTRTKVREPERTYEETGEPARQRTSVTIEDRQLCARYLAGFVEGVKVAPSPRWLQDRLVAAGMRPINNVVDITNYVMLETGQPLHAFDFDRLNGGRIVVRRARDGEGIRTLDGLDRGLSEEMLVIADASRPVAVAGVMGAAEPEVNERTTTVLLEAANFDPVSVRRTSGRLSLRTEASIRFEKGLHPELAAVAARRAMKLLVEVAGGRAATGLVDTYPVKRTDTRVVVMRRRIQQVLGVDLQPAQTRTALTDLGFGCRWTPPDRYVVRSPYWRTDVNQADDVVEEVARVYGYDRLESLPLAGAIPAPYREPLRELRESLQDAAVAAGLQEVMTYPLTSTEELLRVQPADALEVHPPLRIQNPLNKDESVMRSSLRASILRTVANNLRRQRGCVAIFEAARVYLSLPEDLPAEREVMVGAVAGMRLGRWGAPSSEPVDFFDAKGMLEEMFERVGVSASFRAAQDFALLPGRTAELLAGEDRAGVLGQVHPTVAAQFDLSTPVFLFEIDIERLASAVRGLVRHTPPSRFPAVIQDIALLVDAAVPAARVTEIIAANPLVASATLFDVYEGPRLPQGKRSLAFVVQFQSHEKTLTDQEVADARRRIVRRLEHEVGAELRGG